jgi:N-acetylneuraminic acid mutarotase
MHEYTPATDSWVTKNAGGDGAYFTTMAAYNGKIYVHGGRNSTPVVTNTTYEFDIINNSWTQKADGPTLYFHTSAVYDGKMYVYGGNNASDTTKNDLWEYNIGTNTWTQKANGPRTNRLPRMIAKLGKLYVVCGWSGTSHYKNVSVYDIAGDSWGELEDFGGTARYSVSAGEYNGKIYVYGGQSSAGRETDLWEYII